MKTIYNNKNNTVYNTSAKKKVSWVISTSQLNMLPHLHTWPINVVVYHDPMEKTSFEVGFPLRCFQRLSRPYVATLQCHWRDNRCTRGTSTSVLSYQRQLLSVFFTPTADRDRTVSRRSKPSSRTTLIGEQPNPWDLLQPQDVMSRHRGAKRFRRYELLGIISLLSPEYLLSVERWPFLAETTGSL